MEYFHVFYIVNFIPSRDGLESNVLRFMARLNTTRPIDMDRRFIISYFLSDDTILVFEPQQRNSGILGGKFLERRRIKKANQVDYFDAQVSGYSLCKQQLGNQLFK